MMLMKLRILVHVLFFVGVLLPYGASSSSSSSSSEEEQGGSQSKGASHEHWGYEDQESWSSAFKHCSGTSQSPIDVDTNGVTFDPSLPAITLDGYDLTSEPAGLTLFNNGHTLQLQLPDSLQIVSGFDTTFHAAQLHFHWGTVAVPGSEHTIDQVHFPAEMHIVHYNSKYAGLAEAASQADGLAVLGAFIGIGLHENKEYEKILAALTDVSIEESNTEIPGFNVRHLLPNDLRRFYRYTGSLTTPPCFQTVTWTLFNDTVSLSRRQMAALEETLKADQSRQLNKNFRVPQLLHGRSVLASFTDTSSPGGVSPARHDESKAAGIDVHSSTGVHATESLPKGDILAVAFGLLFAVTLLILTVFWCRQRKTHSSVRKESWQDVSYKQAKTQDV